MKEGRALKATVRVFEGGIDEPRVFEATTDLSTAFDGVTAKQVSGPHLEGKLVVSELHFGVSPPGKTSQDCTRKHQVCLEIDGRPAPLDELYENEVELFRRTAEPGQRAYFVTSERL